MVFLYFLARPDWRKGYGFPDFFPAGNRSGLGLVPTIKHPTYFMVRIGFSADVITNTSSNIRLYTAFAMHIVGICPNIM